MNTPQDSPLCLFTRGSRGFGIPIGAVGGVIEPESLVPMPFSPPRLVGLCPHRRQVLPVFRLDEAAPTPAGSVVILIRSDQGLWGIQADRDGIAVVINPSRGEGSTRAPGGIATARHDGRTFDVIDPEACWTALRGEVQDHYHDRAPT
ncbi:MAG: chemotaxis protein CheW [Isosphaeraceae bacterium]